MAIKKADLILAHERENASDGVFSTDPAEITELGDKDAEDCWNDWIESIRSSDSEGVIHAYRLPIDSEGNAVQSKGARFSHLGTWDHQLFTFEQLVEKIRREFVKPGERAHIKFTGAVRGKRGTMFSRIVTIERSVVAQESGESITQLFKLMQDGQRAQADMLREIIQPAVPAVIPVQSKLMENMGEVLKIIGPIAGTVITALITRAPKPKSDLVELIGAMSQMRDFMQGKSDADEETGTAASIIKAVAPALPELLKVLSSGNANRPMVRQNPALMPPTVDRSAVPTSAKPIAAPTPQNPQPTQPAAAAQPQGVTNEMLAQLKPHLEELASLAESGQDPKEVAKLLISMLPENVLDILDNLVQSKESFHRLGMIAPKIKLYAEWFEQLRIAIDAELTNTEGSETPAS